MSIWQRLRRNRLDDELEQEIQAHLTMAVRDRIDRGEGPQAAEAAARREFGNPTLVKEITRDILGWNTFERLFQDLRYALRGLRRSPGFAFIAIASLALGIGANTAIFSLMNAVMFHLLPVQNPGRLVEPLQKYPGEPRGNGYWSWKSYAHFRDHNTVFSAIIGASFDNLLRVQTEHSAPQRAIGEYVTPNYFSDLGVRPAIGRFIGPEDDAASQDVAVVSWNCWRNMLHADPQVIGKRIFVQNQPVTIIGVATPSFVGPRIDQSTDVWLPRKPSQDTLALLARLKPGVTIEQARAEMAVLYRFTIEERARSGDPLVRKLKVEIEPAGNGFNSVRDRFGKLLLILMSVVALLLLLTCVNIASLLLARGAARQREFAVRLGLGASRSRLITQVLTESLLLSVSGTLIGVLLAYFGAGALMRMLASGRIAEQIYLRIQPDLHVFLFTAGIAVATGLLFGLAPALNAVRSKSVSALRQTGSTGETRSKRLFGKSLVIVQVALSVVLLSTGGLFIAHLWNLEHTYLGFGRDHVLLVTLDPSNSGYSQPRLSSGYQEILARLERAPRVRSVALSAPTPLSGAGASGFVNVEGFQESPSDRRWIEISYISPNYFHTIESPRLAGRDFNSQDLLRQRVAIINQTFAERYFAHRSPIGTRITLYHVTLDPQPKTYEIIGVVADAHYADIREPQRRSGVYLPAFHDGFVSAHNFVLRTSTDPEDVVRDVRADVRKVLPNVPILRIITLNAQIDASIVPERLIATLSGSFAALGVLLAGIGIYGLLAYMVARRTNEIGIRMAFGATAGNVRRMVLADTLAIVLAGFGLGIPLAISGRFFASQVVQDLAVQTAVPIASGAIIIVVGALLASYIPVHRAAHVDPMQALRHE